MSDARQIISEPPVAAELQADLDLWIRVLVSIGGRTDKEAQEWTKPLLRGRWESILHEPAAFWVAPALVPPELIAGMGAADYGRLVNDLQFAMDQGDDFWCPATQRELLDAAGRVERVLNEYRARLPHPAASDVLKTNLPRAVALEIAMRSIVRCWPDSTVSDPVRDRVFENPSRIPFGASSRLEVRSADGNRAALWVDAFGLNFAAFSSCYAAAARALGAVRSAIHVNRYHGEPLAA